MNNPETQATMCTRHDTKTKIKQKNISQKNNKINNTKLPEVIAYAC